ncbi:hypothetical protein NDU88_003589 [Pleurodeles waltl]|uniref:Uncharacterized protein n=1 Tax=Pleurodeles waltl TaxID=8319 RepID=A0AAV7UYU4_PLEWA|nr:hypothetical protein NDU88_003589 [Pleurodeles waltl]
MLASKQMVTEREKKETHSVLTGTHPSPELTPSELSAYETLSSAQLTYEAMSSVASAYEVMSSVPNRHPQPDKKARTEPTCMEPENPRRML